MAEIHCKSCKFFQGQSLGTCYRYPENVNKTDSSWCGEYVAIKQHIELLELPVVEMGNSMTVTVEPKKRGRKKKEASDVQTSE